MREGDITLMDAFIDTGIWQIGQLKILNCVRRFKCVYSKSDILQPDGRTVMSEMMDKSEGSSDWTFPKEKPRGKDFELWQTALQHLTSPTLTLYRSVGRYIHEPHKKTGWYLKFLKFYTVITSTLDVFRGELSFPQDNSLTVSY